MDGAGTMAMSATVRLAAHASVTALWKTVQAVSPRIAPSTAATTKNPRVTPRIAKAKLVETAHAMASPTAVESLTTRPNMARARPVLIAVKTESQEVNNWICPAVKVVRMN
ncbi:hypothetical protein PI125_g5594 [Phytophthora idaei]|nr:hypothetical protein PI125_g5594 [Phytophthora idaei]KAG3134805.1 hypothetical protein PI126_g18542 [Phytophthora idaei]